MLKQERFRMTRFVQSLLDRFKLGVKFKRCHRLWVRGEKKYADLIVRHHGHPCENRTTRVGRRQVDSAAPVQYPALRFTDLATAILVGDLGLNRQVGLLQVGNSALRIHAP